MSKLTLAVGALVAIGTLGAAGSVRATSMAHTNYLTFSAPVALPGVSLPAGTYIFEVPLDHGSLDVVRVKSRDGRQIYLTAFTKTVERRASRTATAPIVFGEAERGTPTPVRIWFPIGERIGHEFIY